MTTDESRLFPCSCGDPGHHLRIHVGFEEEPVEFSVITVVNPIAPLRDRIGYAWQALREKDFHMYHEVYLSREQLAALNEYMRETAV